MKTTITEAPPSIQRRRPIDASHLFWSLVIVLFGCFHIRLSFGWNDFFFAVVAILGIVIGVLLQIQVWKFDSTINRQSTEWCRRYYPESGGTLIVDLVVAMAHVVPFDFAALTPSTLLVDLAVPPDGMIENPSFELSEMLQCIADEARIRNVNWSSFSGTTVDDAVRFLNQLTTTGATTKR